MNKTTHVAGYRLEEYEGAGPELLDGDDTSSLICYDDGDVAVYESTIPREAWDAFNEARERFLNRKKHIGSTLDSLLEETGELEEVQQRVRARLLKTEPGATCDECQNSGQYYLGGDEAEEDPGANSWVFCHCESGKILREAAPSLKAPIPDPIPAPRNPLHPGEIFVEEFLKPLGVTLEHFAHYARSKGIRPKDTIDFCAGRISLWRGLAQILADYCGNSVEFWLNLQASYDSGKRGAK